MGSATARNSCPGPLRTHHTGGTRLRSIPNSSPTQGCRPTPRPSLQPLGLSLLSHQACSCPRAFARAIPSAWLVLYPCSEGPLLIVFSVAPRHSRSHRLATAQITLTFLSAKLLCLSHHNGRHSIRFAGRQGTLKSPHSPIGLSPTGCLGPAQTPASWVALVHLPDPQFLHL